MEFLGDDGGGGFRIQKAVADDLTDQFVGTAVIGFGTAGQVLETEGSLLQVTRFDLEVALFGVVVLAGGGGGAQAGALAFDEHGQLVRDDVVGEDSEGTGLAHEGRLIEREGEHKWAEGE